MKEYTINFGNLKAGIHEYEFTAGEKFFSNYSDSLVKHGDFEISLSLDKERETLLILDFELNGSLHLECDTCLDPFDYPVHTARRVVVKLDDKMVDVEEDDIIFLPSDAYQIDLGPLLYEFINLELPMKSTCSLIGKECNPAMTSLINKPLGGSKDAIDPRWDELKKLKDDKNSK